VACLTHASLVYPSRPLRKVGVEPTLPRHLGRFLPAPRAVVPAPQASAPTTLAADPPQGRHAAAVLAVPRCAAGWLPARRALAPVPQASAPATLAVDLPQGRHAVAVLAQRMQRGSLQALMPATADDTPYEHPDEGELHEHVGFDGLGGHGDLGGSR